MPTSGRTHGCGQTVGEGARYCPKCGGKDPYTPPSSRAEAMEEATALVLAVAAFKLLAAGCGKVEQLFRSKSGSAKPTGSLGASLILQPPANARDLLHTRVGTFMVAECRASPKERNPRGFWRFFRSRRDGNQAFRVAERTGPGRSSL